ncbi:MAG: CBS domain-containing protein [Calditrichaeota bacterium]|nr:MAG: CBS domain-containing protein [Calditrichota bacterium]
MDSEKLRAPIHSLNPPTPICVNQEEKLKEVIKTMKDHHIGCVCVVDGQNKLQGIFSERDVLTRVVNKKLDTENTPVKEVMTPDPEYLFYDDEIAFALNRMHVGGFRHIPLLDLEGKPRGIISIKDIISYLIKHLKQTN